MAPRVIIASRSFGSASPKPLQLLEAAGVETAWVDANSPSAQDEILELVPQTSAIIVGLVPITEKIIEHAPQLRVISMYGVGVNHIDLEAARRKGVVVTNCPGSNDQAVADLAMGLMLAVAQHSPVRPRYSRRLLEQIPGRRTVAEKAGPDWVWQYRQGGCPSRQGICDGNQRL